MGTWGNLPWENDSAADWFGDMFDKTKLAEVVEETWMRDIDDSPEEVRAAAAVLLAFGHTFIWPIKKIDEHLALAADRLEAIKQSGFYSDTPEIEAAISLEVEELRSRLKEHSKETPEPQPKAKWWEFWK
jgi:hypothetical protein